MVSEFLNLKRGINAASNELLSALRNKTEECKKEQEDNGRLKKKVKFLETTIKDLEAKVKVGQESQENLTAVMKVIKPVVEQYEWNMEGNKTPQGYSHAIASEVELQAEKSEDLENKLAKRNQLISKWKADLETYSASMDAEDL